MSYWKFDLAELLEGVEEDKARLKALDARLARARRNAPKA